MSKIAFLFPGQGAQYIKMGKDLYENIPECRELFNKGEEILDMPMKKIIFDGSDEILTQTKNNQPAIVLTSLMAQKALSLNGIEADYVAGLSLGEYSALIYSGILSFEDGLKTIKKRARIMDSAVKEGVGGMAAVLKLDRDHINILVDRASEFGKIEVANYNCPGQVVISGEINAINEACGIAKSLRGICKVLNVSGPFHSSLYEEASFKFFNEIKDVKINETGKKVYSNVYAKPYKNDDDIKEILRKQIMSSVLFEDTIKEMIKEGVDTFIEIGPGKVLSGFVKKIDKTLNIYNVEDMKSLEETINSIKEN